MASLRGLELRYKGCTLTPAQMNSSSDEESIFLLGTNQDVLAQDDATNAVESVVEPTCWHFHCFLQDCLRFAG